MPTLRVHKSTLSGAGTDPSLRVHRSVLSGAAVTAPALRVHRSVLSGGGTASILPIPSITVEPDVDVTLTAVPNGPMDRYIWRVIAGLVSLAGTGPQRAFRAPALAAGATITVGVVGLVGNTTSAEVTTTVTVLPSTMKTRSPGRQWKGAEQPAMDRISGGQVGVDTRPTDWISGGEVGVTARPDDIVSGGGPV